MTQKKKKSYNYTYWHSLLFTRDIYISRFLFIKAYHLPHVTKAPKSISFNQDAYCNAVNVFEIMSYMYNTAAGVFLCKFDAPQITRYLYLFKFYTHTVCKHPHTRVRIFRGLKSRFYEIARRITARGEHSDEISRRTTFYINADESIKERENIFVAFFFLRPHLPGG